jgi:hypothetical protein
MKDQLPEDTASPASPESSAPIPSSSASPAEMFDEFMRAEQEAEAEFDRISAEIMALIHEPVHALPERVCLTLSIFEKATPVKVAELLVLFFGLSGARQIRDELANALKPHRYRRYDNLGRFRDDPFFPESPYEGIVE